MAIAPAIARPQRRGSLRLRVSVELWQLRQQLRDPSAEGAAHVLAAGSEGYWVEPDQLNSILFGHWRPGSSGLFHVFCSGAGMESGKVGILLTIEVGVLPCGRKDVIPVLTAQNLVTIGVVRALRDRGREHDIAVVGLDDIALADLVVPGVTVVAQAPGQIGRRAAERLLARIDGAQFPFESIEVPTTLIARGSGKSDPPVYSGVSPMGSASHRNYR